MSEVTNEVASDSTEGKTKRKVLSFSDRIKIVDYLRSLVEPIVLDSNSAVASFVSDATGVDVTWPALKYMIDELPDMKLSAKIHVKSLLTEGALEERVRQLETELAELKRVVSEHIGKSLDDGR